MSEGRYLAERRIAAGILNDPGDSAECILRRGLQPHNVVDTTTRALVVALRGLLTAGAEPEQDTLVLQLVRDRALDACGGTAGLERLMAEYPPGVSIDYQVGWLLEQAARDHSEGLHFSWFDDETVNAIPDQCPLIEGVLSVGAFGAIVGQYATFKTVLGIDMACSVAACRPWHGRAVVQRPVVYVLSEGASALKHRLQSWREANGVFGRIPIHFLTGEVKLTEPDQTARLVGDIRRLGLQEPLVFIDTLNRNFKGSESDDEAMNRFLDGCNTLRRGLGATVVAIHHFGWSAERSRGSSTLPGHLDTEITVAREGERLTLKNSKQKDSAPFPDITLEAFEIGRGLALRGCGETAADLHATDRAILHALSTHFPDGGASASALIAITGLISSTLYKALGRLVAAQYVVTSRKRYSLTPGGRLSAASTLPRLLHDASTPPGRVSPHLPPSKKTGECGTTMQDGAA